MTRGRLIGCALSFAIAFIATGCSADQASVSYTFFEEPGFSVDFVVLEFSDGSLTRQLTGDDFEAETGSRRDTQAFRTRTTGELVTSFWLLQGPDTLSSGELRLDLRSDWTWNISFFRADVNPSGTCFGCVGATPYELEAPAQTAPSDSLWLVWGGNSISDPVVF
jgi:hypothetical protein